MIAPLLEVNHLSLTFLREVDPIQILRGISFNIFPGEIVGLVGESGSGKSLTAAAILGILPSFHEITGHIRFEGKELIDKYLKPALHPRGKSLSLILQDPSLALNPLMSIGCQLIEGLCYHKKISKQKALTIGCEWLERVGIREPKDRMRQFPHELSGGMKQRILIAMALICQPLLLIADEPTTALDVTVQAQILDLLQLLQKEEGLSILLITHDLGVVAHCCQRVMVMYAGQLVETGQVKQVFSNPQHPYTQSLLQSRRCIEQTPKKSLFCLEGNSSLHIPNKGCAFTLRCPSAMRICLEEMPSQEYVADHSIRCWQTKAPKVIR